MLWSSILHLVLFPCSSSFLTFSFRFSLPASHFVTSFLDCFVAGIRFSRLLWRGILYMISATHWSSYLTRNTSRSCSETIIELEFQLTSPSLIISWMILLLSSTYSWNSRSLPFWWNVYWNRISWCAGFYPSCATITQQLRPSQRHLFLLTPLLSSENVLVFVPLLMST